MFCRRVAISICVLVMALSCSKPVKDSAFCNLNIKTGFITPVSLTLEMTDTINTSQLDICIQLNTQNPETYTFIPIVLDMVSPKNLHYTDTLQLPLQIVKTKDVYNRHNGHITLQWPYRKNITTREPGEWLFTLTPSTLPGADEINRKIIGVGISCKKERK